ncbi:MAG TPA: hypothetical protein ACFYD4_14555, partial [Candidatus Wunengus sp. YC61]|uniref:hypothetical protein n=1 Tax=Candidatus Wunengus sp. YC61 TaxID=3367698 RepID=UPI004024DC54
EKKYKEEDVDELIELAIEMLAYVPEYFDNKWHITERFRQLREKITKEVNMKAKVLVIYTCYMCKYSDCENEDMRDWCHRECRILHNPNIIPDWCRLEEFVEKEGL